MGIEWTANFQCISLNRSQKQTKFCALLPLSHIAHILDHTGITMIVAVLKPFVQTDADMTFIEGCVFRHGRNGT
jgi:hypothetical protein